MRTLLFSLFFTCSLWAQTTSLSDGAGVKMFLESKYRCPYWVLTQYYETQKTDSFCGVASSVMVLNALDIRRPIVEELGEGELFTQDNFFTEKVRRIVKPEVVQRRGFTINQLSDALKTFEVKAEAIYASAMDEEQFRVLVKEHFLHKDRFLIANYNRAELDQEGGGHFSPIAAYNQEKDAVLVLDVTRYKYTATWVPLPLFLKSMQTIDRGAKASRGLILVRR
jgi:hypothetical protein